MKLDWLPGLLQELRRHRVEASVIDEVVHQGDQTAPAVLPPDAFVFSDDQAARILAYKDAAVNSDSYEDFIGLIEKVCMELGLNLLTESSKVAAVLNSYRHAEGLRLL